MPGQSENKILEFREFGHGKRSLSLSFLKNVFRDRAKKWLEEGDHVTPSFHFKDRKVQATH